MRFLALAIASKKIQNFQWNLCKVVAIWRSQWNSGFSKSKGTKTKKFFICNIIDSNYYFVI